MGILKQFSGRLVLLLHLSQTEDLTYFTVNRKQTVATELESNDEDNDSASLHTLRSGKRVKPQPVISKRRLMGKVNNEIIRLK